MKRVAWTLALTLGLAGAAHAGGVDIRIGLNYPGVVYYEPAPRVHYYAPRPVYRVYEPRPVYHVYPQYRYHDHGRHASHRGSYRSDRRDYRQHHDHRRGHDHHGRDHRHDRRRHADHRNPPSWRGDHDRDRRR